MTREYVDVLSEKRILGIILRYPAKMDLIANTLTVDHFTVDEHKILWEIISDLYYSNKRISHTAVYRKARGKIDDLETVLTSLTESFIAPEELEPACESVHVQYMKRALLQSAHELAFLIERDAYGDDVRAYYDKAQSTLHRLMYSSDSTGQWKTMLDVFQNVYAELAASKEEKMRQGVLTRLPSIDAMTMGFKRKDLIILAARPSMGKTALALNIAHNVALSGQGSVGIFSLEMSDKQLATRMLLAMLKDSGIDSLALQSELNDAQLKNVDDAINKLYQLPLFVVDKRGLTAADIRAKALRLKYEHPDLTLLVIDYLTLIKIQHQRYESRHIAIGDICQNIRDLAAELDVPILLLAQLNRGVESRENKRPMMSDLRDSGNIEEYADVIMFLYRDDYYYPEKAVENGTAGKVEVIFAKQRNGPTGTVTINFDREHQKFYEYV